MNKKDYLAQRGIAIIAIGKPVYGRMAAMLAATLKVHSPSVAVALLYQDSALLGLEDGHLGLFDYHVKVPNEAIHNGKQYQFAKIHLWELSPFEETMFLDADTVWLDTITPEAALDYCASNYSHYQFQTYGYCTAPLYNNSNTRNYTYWEPPAGLVQYLDFKGHFYCASSTFFWFDRSEKSENLFRLCRQLKETFLSGKMKVRAQNHNQQYPDELIFTVALAFNEHRQAFEKDYRPIYFQYIEKRMSIRAHLENFWALTTSNMPPNEAVRIYNDCSLKACNALKIKHLHLQTK